LQPLRQPLQGHQDRSRGDFFNRCGVITIDSVKFFNHEGLGADGGRRAGAARLRRAVHE
jgi:hypothetical protein